MDENNKIFRIIGILCVIFITCIFFDVMVNEPIRFFESEALAGYSGTTEADPGWAQTNPAFEGVESIYSTDSIHAVNRYGDYLLYVNECWLTAYVAGIPAAPNALLDGAVHNDTVASAVNAGDIIYGTVGGWDDIAIGAPADILTVVGGIPAWQAPVVQTSNLLDNAVHADTVTSAATRGDLVIGTAAGWDDLAIGGAGTVLTSDGNDPSWVLPGALAGAWQQAAESAVVVAGADYTARTGAAIGANIEDVVVVVTCREANSGVVWPAFGSRVPVADFITFYYVEDGSGNLEVHICNDTQIDAFCTVSYSDLL